MESKTVIFVLGLLAVAAAIALVAANFNREPTTVLGARLMYRLRALHRKAPKAPLPSRGATVSEDEHRANRAWETEGGHLDTGRSTSE